MSRSNPKRRKIRVLIVVRWPVGGIRTFLRYMYTNFDTSLYELTILAPEGRETRTLIQDLGVYEPLCITFRDDIGPIGFFFNVVKTVLTQKYDIVHSQGYTAGIISAAPIFLLGMKHILTVHDILLEKQFSPFKKQVVRLALSLILPLYSKIHFVSYDSKNNFYQYLSKTQPCKNDIIISHGIEVERFIDIQRRDFREELNLTKNDFLIGFFGRFMSQKGFKYLVQAIEILKSDRSLLKKPVVLAFGWGGFIREEQREIRKRGLEKNFIFMPFEPNIASALKGLDVVAMPSLWEAFGLLAAEALVAGVPIIGTDCLGLREVLEGTPGVAVAAADSEALAEALVAEMKNPSTRLADAYKSAAARRFDVKEKAQKLQDVMLDLLSYANK